MIAQPWRIVAGVLSLAAAWGTPAAAQLRIADGITASLSGRLNTQFNTTSVDEVEGTPLAGSEFLIRRARLTLDVTFSSLIMARVEPDYGTGSSFALRDAFVRFSFAPAFRATVGQFKRPFDVFGLTSSTQILVIERTGGVRGVDACGALRTVCSFSALTEGLLYADRDLGVMIDGASPGRTLRYAVAVTNGQPVNAREQNGNKSFTARVAVAPLRNVVIGVTGARKDYQHPTTGAERFATGWAVDAELGNFTSGPHVQAGVVGGGNWRTATTVDGVARFLAAQVIATYRASLPHGHLRAVEPLFRVSWGDPDTDAADDGGWLLTPGTMLHFGGRTKLEANLDIWLPQVGPEELSFKSQMSFYF